MCNSAIGKYILVAGLVAGSAMSSSVAVFAHKGATGVVKDRMELMERYDELTDRIFAMLHGELPYSADTVRKAAQEIKKTSGAHLVKLFPKGSDGKPTRATSAVWDNTDTFEHFSEMLEVSADALANSSDKKPEGSTSLPKKWEDVPAMGQGMGRGMGPGRGMGRGPGMMGRGGGPGMMGGGPGRGIGGTVEGATWHLAHVCNTCHTAFRKEE